MATYKDAGVDIGAGDSASAMAYAAAKSTSIGRKGLIGEPVKLEGGFTGALDFGDFYLVMNDDGVGTKVIIGDAIQKYDTLGYDLLAMVCDDAICVGAETVSITNTFDVDKVDANKIGPMMQGLAKACLEHKIVIAGGEIAEVGRLSKGLIWNASAIGIVEKGRFINGKDIKVGDPIIGLRSAGFRSNGFSLVHHVLEKNLGSDWFHKKFDETRTWGEATLTPSKIYHSAVLEMIGRFKQQAKVKVKGVAHITGGGLPGNVPRFFPDPTKMGVYLNNLFPPHEPMLKLQNMDTVRDDEAYQTWNMGTGMVIVSNEVTKVIEIAKKYNIEAQVIGEITDRPGTELISQGYFEKGKSLKFEF